MKRISFLLLTLALIFTPLQAFAAGKESTILNVSYDPTRELYEEINQLFIKDWEAKSGERLTIQQSHGGSGKQARSVMDGLEADVVTLALAYDIDEIAKKGILALDWQKRLENNSSPYISTIVFLVRKGNPKSIKDWDDLVKEGVEVITPNPKTSGGARWNYLAAWNYASKKFNHDEIKTIEYMKALYGNVPVLDAGARGSTTTFVQRGMGDVLLAWENEAHLALKEFAAEGLEIVNPSTSILAEPPVAVVDKIVDKKGTRKVAEAYLKFLYSEPAQVIIGKHFYRPRLASVAERYKDQFPQIQLATIEDFGGWQMAQKKHFSEGGLFDTIYTPAGR